MPIYQYAHPEHPVVIDIVQSMKEPHVFIDEEGVEWRRVWSAPNASVDSHTDPFNSEQFVESTKDTKGTYGDMIDRAKEASEKRTQKLGYDPVKQKYFKEYSKNRQGMKHLRQERE